LPQFEEGILAGEARGYSGATPYVKWGNIPIVLLCVTALAVLAFQRRRAFGAPEESR
jgi:apolipoprotein N-acyltransferase